MAGFRLLTRCLQAQRAAGGRRRLGSSHRSRGRERVPGWLGGGWPPKHHNNGERCPSYGVRIGGWGAKVYDCGCGRNNADGGGRRDVMGGSNGIPATEQAWTRSPCSKRLRRLAPTEDEASPVPSPDDPWAGIVQPHLGGDWSAHMGGQWWSGVVASTMATTATVAAAAV